MINENRFRIKKDGTPFNQSFCRNPELIENYDKAIADTTQTWYCHHRLETHNSDGERRPVSFTHEELITLGMYYDRPPEELIFLTRSEHRSLHSKGKEPWNKGKTCMPYSGKPRSEETKAKISASSKGKHNSEEAKKKMSKAHKGKPSNTKGKHWKLIDGKRVYY